MRANTRGRMAEANKPRVTMLRYNIRAQAQAEVEKAGRRGERPEGEGVRGLRTYHR